MSTTTIPEKTTVLVIGGGPGGSYAAAALVREGHQVVILESAKFPRYHIGESLTAATRTYLRFIGAEDDFVKHGFNPKQGALFQLVQGMEANWTDFQARIPDYETWNVVRSEMDDLLYRHAGKEGALLFDETKVDSIEFENNGDPKTARPVVAHWVNKSGQHGKIAFDWLVDASGKAGVMSTQYLKNRVMRESFRNVAVWSYWKGIRATGRPFSFYAEVLSDKKGWAWFIPLHDGTTSVGFVTHQNTSVDRRSKVGPDGKKMTITEHYADMFQWAPHVKDFLSEGEMIPGTTHSASDYSYWASGYAGDHYRLVGDAANFVDPFFSTGIHIAMSGGLSAAATICSSMRGDVDEKTCQKWHDLKAGMLHVRFLLAVMGAYRRMDLEQQNFDYAQELLCQGHSYFEHAFIGFRKPIQALRKNGDTDEKWTVEDVNNMMDCFDHFFDSTVDEPDVAGVVKEHGIKSISIMAPVLGDDKIEEMTKGEMMASNVLKKYDARKLFGPEVEVNSLKRQALFGYIVGLERGKLGLVKPGDEEMVVGYDPVAKASMAPSAAACAHCGSTETCHCSH
jgi:flavin-dependent dehydrogenase